MEESFHVPAIAKSERVAALLGGPFFIALATMQVAVGLPWLALPFLAMGLSYVWTTWRGFRLARRGVVFDDEGVGPAQDGDRLWTLAWSDYGGFRTTTATPWERFRYPERNGYEVLDRMGLPLFHYLPPQGGVSTSYLTVAARHELRRHLPPGASDPFAPVNRTPQRWVVAAGGGVAVLGAGCAKVGLANPLSSLFGLGLIGSFVGLGGALVATFETISLVRWARGWRPAPSTLPSVPVEGPALDRHVARHAQKPLELKEGRRYRTVDPERTRSGVRDTARLLRGMAVGYGLVGLLVLTIACCDSKVGLVGVGLGVGGIAFGLWMEIASRSSRARLATLDDVLWVHEGHLVVVRSGGEPLVLSLPTSSDRTALRRKSFTAVTDLWRLPDGTRYAVDRTRLYEAPNALENEEL